MKLAKAKSCKSKGNLKRTAACCTCFTSFGFFDSLFCRARRLPLWGSPAVERAPSWRCWSVSTTQSRALYLWTIQISGQTMTHLNTVSSKRAAMQLNYVKWFVCPLHFQSAKCIRLTPERKLNIQSYRKQIGYVGQAGFACLRDTQSMDTCHQDTCRLLFVTWNEQSFSECHCFMKGLNSTFCQGEAWVWIDRIQAAHTSAPLKDSKNGNLTLSQVLCRVKEPVLFATSVRANIMQGSTGATEEDWSFKLWRSEGSDLLEVKNWEKCAKWTYRVRLVEDLQIAASNAQLDFVHNLPQQFDTYVGSGGSAWFFSSRIANMSLLKWKGRCSCEPHANHFQFRFQILLSEHPVP